MKAATKRISIAVLSGAGALFAAVGVGLFGRSGTYVSNAESRAANPTAVYYYDNLKDEAGENYALAKKFYDIIDEMNKTDDFKDGVVSYALGDILTSDDVKGWVIDGNLDIPKAFGAARDSYFFDHPELFYVDLYKLSLSAARTDGVYSAYIDCGREANCYFDRGGLESKKQVEEAIKEYNKALDAAVYVVREKVNKDTGGNDKDAFDNWSDLLVANYANEYLAKGVDYDYDALSYIDANSDYESPYTGNAYGALVKGKCVCRGYSFAFKAILDKFEIPSIIVSGYSLGKNTDGADVEQGEAHSWNYVYLKNPVKPEDAQEAAALNDEAIDSAWYAYDVTWNSARKQYDVNAYITMNAFTTGRNHVADPVVSSAGYKLPYPELTLNSYSNKTVDDDFVHSYIYSPEGGEDDYGNPLMMYEEWVGYKGESALELAARETNKLYILHRYAYYKDGVLEWRPWSAVSEVLKNVVLESDLHKSENTQEHVTKVNIFPEALYSQYMVTDVAPNKVTPPYPNAMYYTDDIELGEHTIFVSQVYTNKTFGTYTPPPYIKSTSPKHTEMTVIADYMMGENDIMADEYAFNMKIEYDEALHVLDESKPIGVEFVTEFKNINKYAMVTSPVTLSADGKTLSFKFKPSLMYEHNSIMYSFYFTNVGSAKKVARKDSNNQVVIETSDKAPNPAHFHFARESIVCSLILGGGRLWVDCCAQPTLVSNSDLAAMDFKDPDGNSTFSEQARSQMMLVVDKVNSETETEIMNTIDKDFGIKQDDIMSSETYDINLQICGKYPTIPDGSYVKIALGFPEGYGPDDEGVTFKLYHRKHIQGDEYIIEEIPCVVTRFGIVATVTSFSPYTVVAVDASKASADKTVYASIDGKGGTLTKEDGKIQTVGLDKSYTYTIKPDKDYIVYRVTLNGVNVTEKVTSDGKLTLNYADLENNNELVIQYIAEAAAKRYAKNNLVLVEPAKVVVDTEGKASLTVSADEVDVAKIVPKSNNTAVIVIVCVILAVVAVTGCTATVILLKRKNKGGAKEN